MTVDGRQSLTVRDAAPIGGPGEVFALTPLQLGMVYESTLAGRPWVNLEQIVVHLEDEDIDPEALRAAWDATAARHDALRLSILWRRRVSPVQVVRPTIATDLTVEDWSHLPPRKQDSTLTQFLDADRDAGIDLEGTPSWRVLLATLGPRRAVMVWTVHHAMVDGRSISIVLQDLFAALGDGAGQPLPPQGTSFSTFCQSLARLDTLGAEQHFRLRLAGFDQPNLIAPEAMGDAAAPSRKRQIERRLDRALTAALSDRAEAAGATLANLINAAWGMVVARWTGREEAVFGITRAGRHLRPGCDRTVGCLINTLPLRLTMAADMTADALLADLRQAALALRPHEHASLSDIRRWAGLSGNMPLFQSMVMFERASLAAELQALGGAWAQRRVDLREEGALPVTLAAYGDASLLLVLEHDPVLVPAARAEALLTHLTEVLASFAKSIAVTPLSHLTMLPRSEEAALLALGRPDRKLGDTAPCIATRLAEVAAASPTAPALGMVGSAVVLTYAALDARANGLAQALRAAGAAPGEIVAICLERSPDFVVAMLAVLKAGAAFLPIDPAYPRSVIDHMLTDCGARLMIAPPVADHPTAMQIITSGAPPATMAPSLIADPNRLAYVIYTSGTTGAPKGVRVPVRALAAHAAAVEAAFALTKTDKVLQFASPSFDVSIEEIIPSLLAGAQLVLRDPAMAGSVGAFLDAVAAKAITVLNLPTAFWHVLVDEMARTGRRLPSAVRLVVVGGEQISPRALAVWQRMAPGPRWLNGYGPTETTITCTLHEPGPIDDTADIPIGRPLGHARAYVLAGDGSLAPLGADGDLWIGGQAVSDGYIGRADDTAAAFHADRFAGEGRMYRTGDRARWRPDGTLAFLGRRDRQVKLRGFRIDLRHVERVIEATPAAGRAVAAVVDAATPAARLVAWVTAADGQGLPDAALLRAQVATQLPPHMLPLLVPVADFPRTPGGKIDVAALPSPTPQHEAGATTIASDPATQRIARLMAATLGLPSIGPDDSFHDLGGHSLLAVQLIGRIEAELDHRLGVGDLHRSPTPRALAAAVAAAQAGPRYIIPIQPGGSRPPIFGVHVLGRNEEYYRPLAAALGPDQPLLGLTVGLLTPDTPIGVPETARRYLEDIQRHYPEGPVSLAAVSLGGYIAFELAQQLLAAGRRVQMLALFDAEGPGGRSKIGGGARLAAHLRRARADGPSYVLHLVENRLTDLRNRVEKLRVRLASRKGEAAPLTIGTFVAANELAVQAYEAQPIDLPLTIFRAMENVFDSPQSAASGLGWAPVARDGFEVIDVPGDHLSILQPPNVEDLARHLIRVQERNRRG